MASFRNSSRPVVQPGRPRQVASLGWMQVVLLCAHWEENWLRLVISVAGPSTAADAHRERRRRHPPAANKGYPD